MAVTTVRVQYAATGKPAPGYRVQLSFTAGLGGVSGSVSSDRYGLARIEHSTVGDAKIIVDGATRMTAHCPGEHTVSV